MSVGDRIDELSSELAAIKEQLEQLSNGKFEAIRKSMAIVAAESRVVVNVITAHGNVIERFERTLTRLDLRCPLMKPDTSEFESVGNKKCGDTEEG
jgi:hypothetical protein